MQEGGAVAKRAVHPDKIETVAQSYWLSALAIPAAGNDTSAMPQVKGHLRAEATTSSDTGQCVLQAIQRVHGMLGEARFHSTVL